LLEADAMKRLSLLLLLAIPLTMNNAEAIESYECHEGNRG
jgi:hypothetical protein